MIKIGAKVKANKHEYYVVSNEGRYRALSDIWPDSGTFCMSEIHFDDTAVIETDEPDHVRIIDPEPTMESMAMVKALKEKWENRYDPIRD